MTRQQTADALKESAFAIIDREGVFEVLRAGEFVDIVEALGRRFLGVEELARRRRRESKTSYIAEKWVTTDRRSFVVFVEGPAAPRVVDARTIGQLTGAIPSAS